MPGSEHDLCAVSELAPPALRRFSLRDGIEVAAVRVEDRVFAFDARCPHRGGPLDRGFVRPDLVAGAPEALRARKDAPVVICPWHHWEFSLDSGTPTFEAGACLRVYRTRVVADRVLVDTARTARG